MFEFFMTALQSTESTARTELTQAVTALNTWTVILPYVGAILAPLLAFWASSQGRNFDERARYQTFIDKRLDELISENKQLERERDALFEENARLKAKLGGFDQ